MRRKQNGFTLIDLVLVVTVALTLTGMAAQAFGNPQRRFAVRGARSTFVALDARARVAAIESGQTVTLVIVPASDSIAVLRGSTPLDAINVPVQRNHPPPREGPPGLPIRRVYALATIGLLGTVGLPTLGWANTVEKQEHEATFGPHGMSSLRNSCEIAVEAKLRTTSPSSFSEARLPNTAVRPGGSTADVTGWVDAKNLFGASARYDYTCHVRVDNLRWLVTHVSVIAR